MSSSVMSPDVPPNSSTTMARCAGPRASGHRGGRIRRYVWAHHARGHPRRDRGRYPPRARRGRSAVDPSGGRPLLGRRPSHAGRPFTGARAPVRTSGSLDRGWARLLGAGARASCRRRADARWLSGRRRAGRPTPRDQRAAAEATVTLPAVLLLVGLILAAASAAIGVAAAATPM